MQQLSARQQRFVDEYVQDFNGAQAAIRAGYSQKAAKEVAYRLLTYTHVTQAVEQQVQEAARKLEISRETVLQGLLEAAAMAKEEGSTLALVSAWREVAKLMGFYPSSRVQIERKVSLDAGLSARQLEQLTDVQLLRIIKGDGAEHVNTVGCTSQKQVATIR